MEEQHQALGRADAQAGGEKGRVGGKSPSTVAEHAGNGKGDGVIGDLSLAQKDEILAGKGDAVLPLANGIVSEIALNGVVPGTGAATEVAVEALVLARRDRQVKDDFTVSGREETAQMCRIGN